MHSPSWLALALAATHCAALGLLQNPITLIYLPAYNHPKALELTTSTYVNHQSKPLPQTPKLLKTTELSSLQGLIKTSQTNQT